MSSVDRFHASVSTLAVSRARVRRGGVSPPLTELDSSRHFFRVIRSSIPGFCVGGMFQSVHIVYDYYEREDRREDQSSKSSMSSSKSSSSSSASSVSGSSAGSAAAAARSTT